MTREIGGIYNFQLPVPGHRFGLTVPCNHICKVQVMRWDATHWLCRRVDNGHPVLAFEEELTEA